MMDWIISNGIEKEIILALNNKQLCLTDISKKTGIPLDKISVTISRMEKNNLIDRKIDYVKDARKKLISMKKGKYKIKKMDSFYFFYFILSIFSIILCLSISLIFNQIYVFFGSILTNFLLFIYMIINMNKDNSKIIVEKFC